ncbi:MAG: hypothetical protein WC796_05190 [Candidatus Pacearchaeota archaeon]|jgi:hypothetical protein
MKEWLTYLIGVIVLVCGIPIGLMLKKATKEELKSGKKYFKIIWIGCLILAVIAAFVPIAVVLKRTVIFSLLFIAIVSFISWKN